MLDMFCGDCKRNEAVFHSIKIINGVKAERHLCPECQIKNPGVPKTAPPFPLSGLSGLFANFSPAPDDTVRRKKSCSVCGTTTREFLESGYLGCDRCYQEFSEILVPVIQKVQSATRHKGKNPRLYGTKPRPQDEYERLKRDLEHAVASESFEEATVIRDRMRVLREQL